MSALTAPMSDPGSSAGGLELLALLAFVTLLILVFEKAVATNVSRPGSVRLSRCLDVGVAPLGIGSLVIGATLLARVLTQGF
jgi:hypothetical protein